ncbi:unnamed protein product [Ambrosiozyma monospora]|uniref:Unnamed protein product n=1 Tax=Ambrosiozyma monospora TaxID=43982 RepID=A0ACB5UAW3_AMBMO|nr:unnamed protein product [Ambrosiozyma monospora]
MFDSLPIEQYDANMQAYYKKRPFPFGNMKGKVLNKSKFLDDGLDVELIMRRNVPPKYAKYFESPTGNDIDGSRKPIKATTSTTTDKNELSHFDEDSLELVGLRKRKLNRLVQVLQD